MLLEPKFSLMLVEKHSIATFFLAISFCHIQFSIIEKYRKNTYNLQEIKRGTTQKSTKRSFKLRFKQRDIATYDGIFFHKQQNSVICKKLKSTKKIS